MKKRTLAAVVVLSCLIGVLLGGTGTRMYTSHFMEKTKRSSQKLRKEEPQNLKNRTNSLTGYETEDSFILTKDCISQVPKNMAIYQTRPLKLENCETMNKEFHFSEGELKKTNTAFTNEMYSEKPIESWKTDWLGGHRILVDCNKDYFQYRVESTSPGELDSTSGAISGLSQREYEKYKKYHKDDLTETDAEIKNDDYYSIKGFDKLNNSKLFSLSNHIEGKIVFDEEIREEYAARTYSREENKMPVLGAFYYKNKEGNRVDGETLAVRMNSIGVIGMTLAHIRCMTDKKEDIEQSNLISMEKASEAVLEYLKSDKDTTRRLSTFEAYAIWYPSMNKKEVLYKPAWYFLADGTCFYKENGQEEQVSDFVTNSFCVDMCTGDVYELYSAEY